MAFFSKLIIFSLLTLFVSACGKKGPAPTLGCSQCRIFVTAVAYDGNLGGIEGADAKCMADANRPAGDEEWKAQITDFTFRSYEDPGWVFRSETPYFRTDGTYIGTTNNLAQLVTLSNAIATNTVNVWTGGDPIHCNFWQSNSNANNSGVGISSSTTQSGFASVVACNQTAHLYCVEQ